VLAGFDKIKLLLLNVLLDPELRAQIGTVREQYKVDSELLFGFAQRILRRFPEGLMEGSVKDYLQKYASVAKPDLGLGNRSFVLQDVGEVDRSIVVACGRAADYIQHEIIFCTDPRMWDTHMGKMYLSRAQPYEKEPVISTLENGLHTAVAFTERMIKLYHDNQDRFPDFDGFYASSYDILQKLMKLPLKKLPSELALSEIASNFDIREGQLMLLPESYLEGLFSATHRNYKSINEVPIGCPARKSVFEIMYRIACLEYLEQDSVDRLLLESDTSSIGDIAGCISALSSRVRGGHSFRTIAQATNSRFRERVGIQAYPWIEDSESFERNMTWRFSEIFSLARQYIHTFKPGEVQKRIEQSGRVSIQDYADIWDTQVNKNGFMIWVESLLHTQEGGKVAPFLAEKWRYGLSMAEWKKLIV